MAAFAAAMEATLRARPDELQRRSPKGNASDPEGVGKPPMTPDPSSPAASAIAWKSVGTACTGVTRAGPGTVVSTVATVTPATRTAHAASTAVEGTGTPTRRQLLRA